jgi:hypothetical protein
VATKDELGAPVIVHDDTPIVPEARNTVEINRAELQRNAETHLESVLSTCRRDGAMPASSWSPPTAVEPDPGTWHQRRPGAGRRRFITGIRRRSSMRLFFSPERAIGGQAQPLSQH